ITMSAAPQMPMPPPSTKPCTAAITGTRLRCTALKVAWLPALTATIRLASAASSLMSTPAQKPRPSARITSARTSARSPNAAISAARPLQPAQFSALTGGWSSTTSATPLSCTSDENDLDMGAPSNMGQRIAALDGLGDDAVDDLAARLQPTDQRRHLAGRHHAFGRLPVAPRALH